MSLTLGKKKIIAVILAVVGVLLLVAGVIVAIVFATKKHNDTSSTTSVYISTPTTTSLPPTQYFNETLTIAFNYGFQGSDNDFNNLQTSLLGLIDRLHFHDNLALQLLPYADIPSKISNKLTQRHDIKAKIKSILLNPRNITGGNPNQANALIAVIAANNPQGRYRRALLAEDSLETKYCLFSPSASNYADSNQLTTDAKDTGSIISDIISMKKFGLVLLDGFSADDYQVKDNQNFVNQKFDNIDSDFIRLLDPDPLPPIVTSTTAASTYISNTTKLLTTSTPKPTTTVIMPPLSTTLVPMINATITTEEPSETLSSKYGTTISEATVSPLNASTEVTSTRQIVTDLTTSKAAFLSSTIFSSQETGTITTDISDTSTTNVPLNFSTEISTDSSELTPLPSTVPISLSSPQPSTDAFETTPTAEMSSTSSKLLSSSPNTTPLETASDITNSTYEITTPESSAQSFTNIMASTSLTEIPETTLRATNLNTPKISTALSTHFSTETDILSTPTLPHNNLSTITAMNSTTISTESVSNGTEMPFTEPTSSDITGITKNFTTKISEISSLCPSTSISSDGTSTFDALTTETMTLGISLGSTEKSPPSQNTEVSSTSFNTKVTITSTTETKNNSPPKMFSTDNYSLSSTNPTTLFTPSPSSESTSIFVTESIASKSSVFSTDPSTSSTTSTSIISSASS